jgi:hypothetical protein
VAVDLRVYFDFAGGFRVEWALIDDFRPSDSLRFTVLRGPTEHGPFSAVSSPLIDETEFFDSFAQIGHRSKAFYKIRVQDLQTDADAELPDLGRRCGDLPGPEALRIGNENHRKLRQDGRACAIFPLRSFGPPCPVCVDHVTQRRKLSQCVHCYDTGVAGGFHRPIVVYHSWKEGPERANNAPLPANPLGRSLLLPATPTVAPDFVIAEADGTRWRVLSMERDHHRGYPVQQRGSAGLVAADDVIYKLPLTVDLAEYDVHHQTTDSPNCQQAVLGQVLRLFE